MAKLVTLFGEEELQEPGKAAVKKTYLPMIPVAKKKGVKTDTPFEKEVRRFNRLIKELHDYENEADKQRQSKEEYERLYRTRLVPVLVKLANARFKFAEHLHGIFSVNKFSKPEKRTFVKFILNLLQDTSQFVPESKGLVEAYLNLNVQLLTGRDKAAMKDLMEESGIEGVDLNNFDVNDLFNQHMDYFESRYDDEDTNATSKARAIKKSAAQIKEETDINTLYRELAKLLHPDLEADEKIRQEKEHLMKELSDAKQQKDLHAMLVIKSKAAVLSGKPDQYTQDAEQLKRYNKQLSKKLSELKENQLAQLFDNISMDRNGFLSMKDPTLNPEVMIEKELRAAEHELKSIVKDTKKINTYEDLKDLMEVCRNLDY